MKKILFDFTPYVLGSWDIMVTRYNHNSEIISQTKFVAHKIDGEIVFENFDADSAILNSAEIDYIQTILLNS
jgi:hypothetical protein